MNKEGMIFFTGLITGIKDKRIMNNPKTFEEWVNENKLPLNSIKAVSRLWEAAIESEKDTAKIIGNSLDDLAKDDLNSFYTIRATKRLKRLYKKLSSNSYKETKIILLKSGDRVKAIQKLGISRTEREGVIIPQDEYGRLLNKDLMYKIDFENGFVGWYKRDDLIILK